MQEKFNQVSYECKICEERFIQIAKLKRHEMLHTGEEQYTCNTCKKTFRHRFDLKIHERRHIGEVPFQCGTFKDTKSRICHVFNYFMISRIKYYFL